MVGTPRKMCDACHVREATHHSVTIEHGMQQTSELCADCFARIGPAMARDLVAGVSEESCRFCGAQATSGGPDMAQIVVGVQQMIYMCHECSVEYYRYLSEEMRSITHSQQHRPLEIESVMQGIPPHMERWVADKSERGDA